MKNNPISDRWARRIIRSVKFTEGFRGDNVRRTKDSAYVGSRGSDRGGLVALSWRPLPFRVISIEDEFLTCRPYSIEKDNQGEKEVKIAKPPHLRLSYNDDVAKTVTPAYVPNASVIWAAPFRHHGGADGGDQLTLMDLNLDGRNTTYFWAKITGESGDGANKWNYTFEEQARTESGWEKLESGRAGGVAKNSVESNNDGSGVQGNSVDIDGSIFTDNSNLEIQPIQGDPIVLMREDTSEAGVDLYTIINYVNAVDGECA